MEEHNFLGASWEDPGVRRNIRKIPAVEGFVVAYEIQGRVGTRVPGFYVKDLTVEEYPYGDGMVVTSVPMNLRSDIMKILQANGYREPVDFE